MNNTCQAMKKSPRILVINPNTNIEVTANIRQLMINITPAGVLLKVTSPSTGPFVIESDQDKQVATKQVLSLIQQKQEDGFTGYIMACFDDIAIAEVRATMQCPIISLAEAGIRSAADAGGMFTVITTVDNAVPTIQTLSQLYGVDHRCQVVATGIGVADTVAQTKDAEQRLHIAITTALQRGSKAIVLGSGAFAGRAQTLSERYHIDVKDGFKEALNYLIKQT